MTQGAANPGMVALTPAEYVVPVGQLNARLTSIQLPPPQQHQHSLPYTQPPAILPRPNPSLSNKGLVIVQVQQNDRQQQPSSSHPEGLTGGCRLLPVYDSVLKTSVCQEDGREEAAVSHHLEHNMAAAAAGGDERPGDRQLAASYPRQDILSSATHQLIHGYPPFLHHDDVEEEEDEEEDDDIGDDFEDTEYSPPPSAEDPDEGYRTNSSSSFGGSPSSSVHSPAPSREETATTAAAATMRREEEEGTNNLMWLVDFKLDFFNDIDKNGERTGTGVINLHIFMT
jgi:hypothetical protein